MASFTVHGIDEISAAFERASGVPDEIKKKVLVAMAEEAKKAIETEGSYIKDPESDVHFIEKLKINSPKLSDSGGSITITFSGTRKRGNTTTRNAEIAFINEFGKKGVAARMFVRGGLEKYSERIFDAGDRVLHNWIEST